MFRSASARLAPWALNALAVALPIPPAAPTIRTVLPLQLSVSVTILPLEFDDGVAAIDNDHRARDVACIVPCQKTDCCGHFLWSTRPADRRGIAGDNLGFG